MARVKTSEDYEKEIEDINIKISDYKAEIKKLTKERKTLANKQKNADFESALLIIKEKGITGSELLEMVSKVKK